MFTGEAIQSTQNIEKPMGSKNPTPAFGPSGLSHRPFGPHTVRPFQ